VPATIAPVVTDVLNLNDFKPRPLHVRGKSVSAKPQYTFCGDNSCSTANQGVLFAPGDIKVAYDINPLITAGNTGSGQIIAIMGQSAIQTSDIENFQQAASLTVKDPIMTLVAGSGTSTIQADGDESESDLDVEWSGATAPGAQVNFVYTGNNPNYGVFDSYQYAVDQQLGNIISISYGTCETELASSDYSSLESIGEQAATQGQTVVSASGDSGATACYGYTNLTTQQQNAETVSYPASSAYVTGVGGTEISSADDVVGQYWSGANATTGITLTTALSYIPEVAWNDDLLTIQSFSQNGINCATNFECLSSGGGGISALTTRPSWQTGVTGLPSGTMRAVPDVALYASPNLPGYLYCTSDQSAWGQGQLGSCGAGQFYDPNSQFFTIAGGTSFAAPIFAGELAIMNQAKGYTTGQGLVNTELYKLAAVAATYGTAFHDVTTGSNACTGSSSCPSTSGFSAGTGYDQVTGLGSVDLNNLVTAWPMSTSTLVGTTTAVSASNTSPNVNASVTFTVTVTANTGSTTPTGSVTLEIDGGTAYGGTTLSGQTLTSSGTLTYTTSFASAGSHQVIAKYAGSSSFGWSTGVGSVNVQGSSTGTGSFKMAFSPSTLTVSQGSSGTETLTVTPSTSPAYTGTVILSFETSNNNALQNLCVTGGTGITSSGDIVVSGSSAVTGQIIIDTNASDCASAAAVAALAKRGLHVIPHTGKTVKTTANKNDRGSLPAGLALAGLLLAGFLGRSSRKLRGLACVIALAAIGLAMTACGSSNNNNNTIPNPAKGTYTITFSGQDSAAQTITGSASFTLTID
jgi:subtilase family serine protease